MTAKQIDFVKSSTIFVLLVALVLSGRALASEEVRTSFNLGYFNQLAMNGYDVMTYWNGGDPKKGREEFSMDFGGAKWLFVSAQHLQQFAANPEKYAPQFGGYCAYAASQGALADVDPFAWRIWQDRLYLNYSPVVRRQWASDIDANIERGEKHWPGLDPAKQ